METNIYRANTNEKLYTTTDNDKKRMRSYFRMGFHWLVKSGCYSTYQNKLYCINSVYKIHFFFKITCTDELLTTTRKVTSC